LIALQYILDAINIGGLYAMMALGIGLIFGIMRLINFAHGEMVMAGGYAIGLLATLPTPLVIVLSLVFIIALRRVILLAEPDGDDLWCPPAAIYLRARPGRHH
jgi:branched-chain amino acid transport system permease protein